MGIVPQKKTARVAWYATKTAPWTAHAVAIGTTAAAVTNLATKLTAAESAIADADAAKESAKAKTAIADDAVTELGRVGAAIITQIRAKAAVDGNGIYNLAEIPAPATPSPVGPPGMPFDFKVTLLPDGSLKLKWKCPNPVGAVGTTYQVQRRIGAGGASGAFVPLTTVGTRFLTDTTVPAGTASVTYKITATRSTAVGPANEFVVNFGTGASGEMFASVAQAPKLAA